MNRRQFRTWATAVVLLGGLSGAAFVQAQQTTLIKDILVNPTAYHRQAVVVRGKVLMPGEVRGVNAWGQQLCGQQFLLEDDTGRLLLRSLMICQPDNDSEMRVRHGEAVTIEATVEAAPPNMQTVTGRGLGFGAMVTRVTHEDHGTPHVSIEPIQ